jgi:hypothetical protein
MNPRTPTLSVIFLLFIFECLGVHDTLFVKRFWCLEVSNTVLLPRFPSINYVSEPRYVHDKYRNLEIHDHISFFNPSMSVIFNREFFKIKTPSGKSTFFLYWNLKVGLQLLNYGTTKVGSEIGGYVGINFNGVIKEKANSGLANISAGFDLYRSRRYLNTDFISLSIDWSQLLWSSFTATYSQHSNGEGWINENKFNFGSSSNIRSNVGIPVELYYSSYSMSIGRILRIKSHIVSVCLKYSITGYMLFNREFVVGFNSSFLKNMDIFTLAMKWYIQP